TAAATVSTAAAAPTAAAPAAAKPAPAAAAAFLGPGFVHRQRTAFHFLAVESLDRGLRLLIIAHFHEPEPLRPTGVAVHDDLGRLHGPVRFEHLLQVTVGNRVGQVTHVQLLAHGGPPRENRSAVPAPTPERKDRAKTLSKVTWDREREGKMVRGAS